MSNSDCLRKVFVGSDVIAVTNINHAPGLEEDPVPGILCFTP